MLFFNIMEHHHTSTLRWQHSWIGSCLSSGSAKGGACTGLHDLLMWLLFDFFLWGFVKDEVYVLPEPITHNNLKDWIQTVIAKIGQPFFAKCLAWSQISWWVQSDKWNIYWTWIRYEKNFLSCLLQWFVFNFCVAITFLPLNLCNCSRHL
jgi:hypothetical protein